MLKRQKRVVLHRTDHRIDIGPAGRNLFISRDKQIQSRQARRLKLWMRAVLALGAVALAAGAGLFAAFYMVPYFREEVTLPSEDETLADTLSELPAYDEQGLPLYPDEVSLFLINRDNPQDSTYVPTTVEVAGVQVEAHAAMALQRLVEAAGEDGLALTFTEGYVSCEEQQRRYEARVEALMEEGLTTVMARTQAQEEAPPGGQSDQQTGLCLRVAGDPETFPDSRTCSWLRSNMGKYGFVFRWPEGDEDFTGCAADLTVIRYVGSAHATAMTQRSMCLEEYVDYLSRQ